MYFHLPLEKKKDFVMTSFATRLHFPLHFFIYHWVE